MLWVLGILLVIVTGTWAPFSAMSGAVSTMSLLGWAFATPSDFNASAAALASNPDLFHAAASALVDLNNPAPAAIASGMAALIAFNNVLRY
jgi:hypothetical protein